MLSSSVEVYSTYSLYLTIHVFLDAFFNEKGHLSKLTLLCFISITAIFFYIFLCTFTKYVTICY